MEYRPKILVPLTGCDKSIGVLCMVLMFSLWLQVLVFYTSLPQTIPIHFNGKGQVDDYGNKASVFTLPVVATLIYIGMTLLNKRPYILNYGIPVTPANAHLLYAQATRFFRIQKLLVVAIFLAIVVVVLRTSLDQSAMPGPLLLPVLLAPLLLFMGYFMFSLWRKQ